ncbi:hypothetical protein AB1286_07405 [Trinickia sp. NRRL B-1857]|uniref:hypothetical protein n=1 Tax=Trinickia sp. NRRL B-1857 TaxID=3162879 RepID=UPI003D2BD785
MKSRRLGDVFGRLGLGRRARKGVRFGPTEVAVQRVEEEGDAANGVPEIDASEDELGAVAASNLDVEHYLRLAEGMLAEADGELGKIENLMRADKPRSIDPLTGRDRVEYELPRGVRKAYQRGLIDGYRDNAERFMNAASQYHNYALRIVAASDVSMDSLFDRVALRHERLGLRLLRL